METQINNPVNKEMAGYICVWDMDMRIGNTQNKR